VQAIVAPARGNLFRERRYATMQAISTDFEPGQFVRHPDEPGWGLGQVQSALGEKVTVSFSEAGKRTINTTVVALEIVPEPAAGTAAP